MILNKWTLRPKAVDRPTEIEDPAVIFIDYDGTELYTYSLVEANALTALPANPTHEGLVSQGWNWTLANIKDQLLDTPETTIVVGQLYVTESGATEIDIELGDVWKSPYLTMGVNGTATIDWGDNSTTDTVTGTDIATRINTQHVYDNGGNYTIKISVNNGSARLIGITNNRSFFSNLSGSPGYNEQYNQAVKFVRFGNNMQIGDSTFYRCANLQYVTISNSAIQKGSYVFKQCYHLKSVTILYDSSMTIGTQSFYNDFALEYVSFPYGITLFTEWVLNDCLSLKYLTIPLTATKLSVNAFVGCRSLTKIIIPSTTTDCSNFTVTDSLTIKTIVFKGGTTTSSYSSGTYRNCYLLNNIELPYNCTTIANRAFENCRTLKNINLPSTIISIGDSAFLSCCNLESITIPSLVETIGSGVFRGCRKLKSIEFPYGVSTINGTVCLDCFALSLVIIPSTVTMIKAQAFQNNRGAKEFHFLSTTPPELENVNAFLNISNDCIFYVPSGSLTAYQTATNWSDFASYMQEE